MIVSIGYLASLFLAISLIMTNAVKFRWFNILGCVAFITYGLLISAFPIVLANSVLLFINVYQLSKLYKNKEQFKLVSITQDNNIVQEFVAFYKDDIKTYFPDFEFATNENKISFVVLRNLNIANLFVAEVTSTGEAIVEINYTIANYRDYKVSKFIFNTEREYLQQHHVSKIVYKSVNNKSYLDFLLVMGFKEVVVNNTKEYHKHL